jgi:hypothetical protein
MAKKPTQTAKQSPTVEIGVSGLKQASGYIYEEFLPQLHGQKGIRIYQEMVSNDATAAAVLNAIGLVVGSVKWDVNAADDTPEAKAEADFGTSLMEDMSHSWGDFISEALTMLPFGWSYHEIVYKRRGGPESDDPANRSKYTDGRIGIRKLAPRSQDTLQRWEMQEDGGISGMWQIPWIGGGERFVPIDRALLFRTVSRKNSPEGVSIFRSAYRSWHKVKYIEDFEAIGIERELAGMPIVRIPKQYFESDVSPKDRAVRATYESIAKQLRFNEQGGLVIPSDTFRNPDGSYSNVPLVDIKLLASGGTRSIDTSRVAERYYRNIARSALADFLTLGQGTVSARGSYGMHESQVDLFMQACESILDQIEEPLNRFMMPRVWRLNGLDQRLMPQVKHGKVQDISPELLARIVGDLARSGMELFPDDKVEDHVRAKVGLPLKAAEQKL